MNTVRFTPEWQKNAQPFLEEAVLLVGPREIHVEEQKVLQMLPLQVGRKEREREGSAAHKVLNRVHRYHILDNTYLSSECNGKRSTQTTLENRDFRAKMPTHVRDGILTPAFEAHVIYLTQVSSTPSSNNLAVLILLRFCLYALELELELKQARRLVPRVIAQIVL